MYQSNFVPANYVGFTFKGKPSPRIIDCVDGQYTRNAFGFIRSDFAELQAAQDSSAYFRALQKMQEIANNEPDNSDLSFDEIVAMVRPRWCQSPAEMDRFELYCIDNALDTYAKLKKLDDEQKEALAKAKAKEIEELRASLQIAPPDVPKNE